MSYHHHVLSLPWVLGTSLFAAWVFLPSCVNGARHAWKDRSR